MTKQSPKKAPAKAGAVAGVGPLEKAQKLRMQLDDFAIPDDEADWVQGYSIGDDDQFIAALDSVAMAMPAQAQIIAAAINRQREQFFRIYDQHWTQIELERELADLRPKEITARGGLGRSEPEWWDECASRAAQLLATGTSLGELVGKLEKRFPHGPKAIRNALKNKGVK